MTISIVRKCLIDAWQTITLEPTLALYFIVYEMVSFLETNLLLHKTCRSDFSESSSSSELVRFCNDERRGQQYVATANSWKNLTKAYLSIVFVALCSARSDRNLERRHLIYWPLFGCLAFALIGAFNSYFWTWNPIVIPIASALLQGSTGGKLSIMFGSQLYISSITDPSNRTSRIGVIVALHYICLLIGSGLSGHLNVYLGFTKSFLLCVALLLTALSVGYWKIRPSDDNNPTGLSNNSTDVRKSLTLIFKKRPRNKRLIVLCLLVLDAIGMVSFLGEQTVTYLYFRYRFGWQEKAYSVYTAYKMLGTLFGTMFCTVYMSKYLKIHDGFIGTLAAFWDTVGNISYFFADQTWELYVIPLYNIFNGVLFAMMASLSTKCVEPNEMGYLTSVRSLMQIISPLSFPLYGLVYRSTLDVLPQAFFLLSVLFNFPTIILFGIAYYYSKDIIFDTQQDTVQSTIDNNPVGTDNVTDDTSPSAVENGRVKKPDELQ